MRPVAAPNSNPSGATTSDDRAEAIRRVSAYFHSLGINDYARLTEASIRVLDRVGRETPHLQGAELVTTAMNEARRVVRVWLGRLVDKGLLPQPSTATSGLTIWRLRSALQQYPGAFLRTFDLPEGFVAAMQRPVPRSLPDTLSGHMESQRIECPCLKLPAKLVRTVQSLHNVTHDLAYKVVAGR